MDTLLHPYIVMNIFLEIHETNVEGKRKILRNYSYALLSSFSFPSYPPPLPFPPLFLCHIQSLLPRLIAEKASRDKTMGLVEIEEVRRIRRSKKRKVEGGLYKERRIYSFLSLSRSFAQLKKSLKPEPISKSK